MKAIATLLVAFLFCAPPALVVITLLLNRRIHRHHRQFAVDAVGDDHLSLLDMVVLGKIEGELTARSVRELRDAVVQRLWKIRSYLSVAFGLGFTAVFVAGLIRGTDKAKTADRAVPEVIVGPQIDLADATVWIYLAALALLVLSSLFVLVSTLLIHQRLSTHHTVFLEEATGSTLRLSPFNAARTRKVTLHLPSYLRAEPIDRWLLGLVRARKIANWLGLLGFVSAVLFSVAAVPK